MPHERFHPHPASIIAVTGSTGLIGSALVDHLRERGHTVRRIVRSRPRTDDIVWDPMRGELDPRDLSGVDGVVHLAGEPVGHRWTKRRRRAIRDSRVQGTALLARTISELPLKPRVFLSGSAVGYYGNRDDELLDETTPPGADFLARVSVDWERAAEAAAQAGVRTVLMRTGIVMSANGGALARLLPIFKLGLGGRLGDGHKWMSWIALRDHVRAMEHALFSDALRGAANFVAPNPVHNAEFATTLGRVLARPALIPVPALVLELLYGEMARDTLLAGQRAIPRALALSGFEFSYPTLESALRSIVSGDVGTVV